MKWLTLETTRLLWNILRKLSISILKISGQSIQSIINKNSKLPVLWLCMYHFMHWFWVGPLWWSQNFRDAGGIALILFLLCLFFFTAALNRYSMSRVSSDRPFPNGYCWNGYSKIWWDTSWHIKRYKQINDALFRQRITAGSATDL